jgi:hypothetical protein
MDRGFLYSDSLTLVVATGATSNLVTGVSSTDLIHVNPRLDPSDQVCRDADEYPMAAKGAVGFIEDKKVRVCGGIDSR